MPLRGLVSIFSSMLVACASQSLSRQPASDDYAYAQPLIDELNKLVDVTTDSPVTLWSWFNEKHYEKTWRSVHQASDPAGYAYLTARARQYWQSLCTDDLKDNPSDCTHGDQSQPGNIFGVGLYLATDPVVTQEYGGGPGWLLCKCRCRQDFG